MTDEEFKSFILFAGLKVADFRVNPDNSVIITLKRRRKEFLLEIRQGIVTLLEKFKGKFKVLFTQSTDVIYTWTANITTAATTIQIPVTYAPTSNYYTTTTAAGDSWTIAPSFSTSAVNNC